LLCVTVSFDRKVLKSLRLADGTFLPKGTRVIAPALAISADPDVYEDPETFDGLRFYKMRQRSPADENKYQITSTSKNMMHFGAGRHACPGRWFMSVELKMLLAGTLQFSSAISKLS